MPGRMAELTVSWKRLPRHGSPLAAPVESSRSCWRFQIASLGLESSRLAVQSAPFPAVCRRRTNAKLFEITWCCCGFVAGVYVASACS